MKATLFSSFILHPLLDELYYSGYHAQRDGGALKVGPCAARTSRNPPGPKGSTGTESFWGAAVQPNRSFAVAGIDDHRLISGGGLFIHRRER